MAIPAILILFGLSVVVEKAQDTTIQIKGYLRFLNSTHLYINKNASVAVLPFDVIFTCPYAYFNEKNNCDNTLNKQKCYYYLYKLALNYGMTS